MAKPIAVSDVVALLMSVLGLSFVVFVTRIRSILRGRLPPGPRGWPVFGSLLRLGNLTHQSLQELAKKHGPLMFMYMGSVPTLVVSNAEMAQEVLQNNDQNTASRPHLMIPDYLTCGSKNILFSPYGPNWHHVRKIVSSHLLTQAHIDGSKDVRQREVLKTVQCISDESQKGNPILVLDVFRSMTTNIMTQMMWKKGYGIGAGSISADKEAVELQNMIQATTDLAGTKNIADFIPILKPLVLRLFGGRMKSVHQLAHNSVEAIFREHELDRVKSLSQARGTAAAPDTDDFVNVILKLTSQTSHKDCETLPRETARGVLLDMLIGGSEPLSVTLEWALLELLRQPKIMKRAQDELTAVVGPDRMVEEKYIPSLNYLQAVVKEVLRLHPVYPLAFPHASLYNSQIGGFHVPARTSILINVYAIQRDPARWDRPLKFDPERFLGSNSSVGFRGEDFNLIPFSAGRRMCPGADLASSILHIALAQLLHAFNWNLSTDNECGRLDISEQLALSCKTAIPLRALAKPRLANHVLLSA